MFYHSISILAAMPSNMFSSKSISGTKAYSANELTDLFRDAVEIAIDNEFLELLKLKRMKLGQAFDCQKYLNDMAGGFLGIGERDMTPFLSKCNKLAEASSSDGQGISEKTVPDLSNQGGIQSLVSELSQRLNGLNQNLSAVTSSLQQTEIDPDTIGNAYFEYSKTHAEIVTIPAFSILLTDPTNYEQFERKMSIAEISAKSSHNSGFLNPENLSSALGSRIDDYENAVAYLLDRKDSVADGNLKKIAQRTSQYRTLHLIGLMNLMFPYSLGPALAKNPAHALSVRCGIAILRENQQVASFTENAVMVLSLIPAVGALSKGAMAVKAVAGAMGMRGGIGAVMKRSAIALGEGFSKQSAVYFMIDFPIFLTDLAILKDNFKLRSQMQLLQYSSLVGGRALSATQIQEVDEAMKSLKWQVAFTVLAGVATLADAITITAKAVKSIKSGKPATEAIQQATNQIKSGKVGAVCKLALAGCSAGAPDFSENLNSSSFKYFADENPKNWSTEKWAEFADGFPPAARQILRSTIGSSTPYMTVRLADGRQVQGFFEGYARLEDSGDMVLLIRKASGDTYTAISPNADIEEVIRTVDTVFPDGTLLPTELRVFAKNAGGGTPNISDPFLDIPQHYAGRRVVVHYHDVPESDLTQEAFQKLFRNTATSAEGKLGTAKGSEVTIDGDGIYSEFSSIYKVEVEAKSYSFRAAENANFKDIDANIEEGTEVVLSYFNRGKQLAQKAEGRYMGIKDLGEGKTGIIMETVCQSGNPCFKIFDSITDLQTRNFGSSQGMETVFNSNPVPGA